MLTRREYNLTQGFNKIWEYHNFGPRYEASGKRQAHISRRISPSPKRRRIFPNSMNSTESATKLKQTPRYRGYKNRPSRQKHRANKNNKKKNLMLDKTHVSIPIGTEMTSSLAVQTSSKMPVLMAVSSSVLHADTVDPLTLDIHADTVDPSSLEPSDIKAVDDTVDPTLDIHAETVDPSSLEPSDNEAVDASTIEINNKADDLEIYNEDFDLNVDITTTQPIDLF